MKKLVLLFSVIILAMGVKAQTGYAFRVQFMDKTGGLTIADSLQFLSQKSLDRRNRQNIAVDSTDIPVVQAYIDSVMNVSAAVKLHNRSKWFNQIVVITYDSSKVNDVLNLPFVSGAKLVARYLNFSPKPEAQEPKGLSAQKMQHSISQVSNKTLGDPAYYGLTFQQINLNNGDYLHDLGFRGEGMTVAVLDAGFKYANTHTQFDSLNNSGRMLGGYNFVSDSNYVYNVNYDHGTNVVGLIIGEDPGTYIGCAPKANMYYLLTEDVYSEQPIEADNWLSAAEWADSAGADVINGSLGYNEFDAPHVSYTWSGDLNGNKTLIARAANKAVSKGIFTCVAQGNSGGQTWHYMMTPADADSAYSVGSVDGSGAWATSGYGPNADGQTKPNGMAMGKAVVLIGGNGLPGTSNGSSFASPLIAGMVSCLWQGAPQLTESELRHLVMQVSDRYTNPNNTHGFGIPNFKLAYNLATGIDEFETKSASDFQVYPNPTNDEFTIRVKQSFLPYDFELYNLNGKRVSNLEGINNINYQNSVLKNLIPGTYFIKLKSAKRIENATIIKQ